MSKKNVSSFFTPEDWDHLRTNIKGELHTNLPIRSVYSNDASIYEQIPAAVAIPYDDGDLLKLIRFANQMQIGLIPRTAGTSLAGQAVGDGLVVDLSKHFTSILETDVDECWTRVQPGVIRDELNRELNKVGLHFAPETSTSNRAMIGGMLGNNSCGSNSIAYGTTRDYVQEISGFLSDGSFVTFGPMKVAELESKVLSQEQSRENDIYRRVLQSLRNRETQNKIRDFFPKPSINRRNTGYAIDALLETEPFGGQQKFNLAKLIAGSEGTLFFATSIRLACVPLPPKSTILVCAHFNDLQQSLRATQIAMRHKPFRCELIDRHVIDGARNNLSQRDGLDFLVDEPEAVLLIEFRGDEQTAVQELANAAVAEIREAGLGYAFPTAIPPESDKVWSVRKSGLGVVNNRPGKAKPTTVIEDTAVALEDLPAFIAEVDSLLDREFDATCVHYGHVGAGELHLRPSLNLSDPNEIKKLRGISLSVAKLVKKYQGSLSGEHGDGRLRSEHLRMMFGDEVYELLRDIKRTFDPNNIFNPGKIVDPVSMSEHLKAPAPTDPTGSLPIFRFEQGGGLLGAASMCTGSGDCRKSQLAGGTMCPSYMATRNEYDSTRARANLLRQFLTQPRTTQPKTNQASGISDGDALEVMRLCLSCKACKSECPSNVDMARIKAEFTQSYFDQHGTPMKARLFGSFERWCRRLARVSSIANMAGSNQLASKILKRTLGIHPDRSLPRIAGVSLRKWFASRQAMQSSAPKKRCVYLFCDEFTNHIDTHIGRATVELLELLGYEVRLPEHVESGRSAMSAGMVRAGKKLAEQNVLRLTDQLNDADVLIGIEPSAILTLRDEYPDLVDARLAAKARRLADQTLLIDEFLSREASDGQITSDQFESTKMSLLLHGHCHQKALSSLTHTEKILQLPANSAVTTPNTGCCGMAGFFGYETDKYQLSMQIGELALFPTVREATTDTIIVATGTSCRHQIQDGTGRAAYHPVEILRQRVLT